MGQPIGGGNDTAAQGGVLLAGTFTGATNSAAATIYGSFNVSLWGTFGATVQLQRTFDGGVTWLPVSADVAGDALVWGAPFSGTWTEVEKQVGYRLVCTAYVSGTVNYRISQASEFIWTGGLSR
jgi:hypothetical protein